MPSLVLGDQIGGAGLSVVPTKSVALFSGPVKLDKSGHAVVAIDVPNEPAVMRAKLKSPDADGILSGESPDRLSVTSGMKKIAIAVAVLCGTPLLLLITNNGARLGFHLAVQFGLQLRPFPRSPER